MSTETNNSSSEAHGPVACRACQSETWTLVLSSEVTLDTKSGEVTADPVQKEQLKCASCGRKANLEQNKELRETEAYKKVPEIEV